MGTVDVRRYAWRLSAVPVPVLNVPSAEPSTSRGPRLNTSRFCGAMIALAITWVECVASPGAESSCSTTTCAGKSGCTLDTTMAYCCAAAFSDGDTSALSRSAPQYSQPTFDCSAEAWLHSCWHPPPRHAYPCVGSHTRVGFQVCPAASQVTTDCCSQLVEPGLHFAHADSAATQIWPAAPQSVVACHRGGVRG